MGPAARLPDLAPPAYSEWDPNDQQRAQSDISLAKAMLRMIEIQPLVNQRRIIERMIILFNASAPNLSDRIVLANSGGFAEQYPRLNELIKKLDFIPRAKVGYFAFVCGLYSQYCEAKTSSPSVAQARIAFFQKFFQIQGSDEGIKKLHLFKSCDILYPKNKEKLTAILEDVDVECLPRTLEKPINPQFDYQLVFTKVVNKLGDHNGLFRKLNLSDDEFDRLCEQAGEKEGRSELLIMLHEVAQQGRPTSDLLQALKKISRTDLSEGLAKALRGTNVSVQCTEDPHKKFKSSW